MTSSPGIPSGFPACLEHDFISEAEEQSMLEYLTPQLERIEFECNHTDGLITNFVELYRNVDEFPVGPCTDVIARCRDFAARVVPTGARLQDRVHVIRLQPEGVILPHVDNVKNSSGCVCGLSLGADREMMLTHPTDADAKPVALDLRRRSFYALHGAARTTWHHSVQGLSPPRGGPRVSLIFRGVPASVYVFERFMKKKRGMKP
eukprot:PhM_4_TR12770/c0_g1_i1/m.89777/K10769/ALKBH7; alkylated DNA repair protein alkB homolog 7